MTDRMSRYRTLDVAVAGGEMRVGLWEGPSDAAPAVLLIHGVTASHLSWPFVAERLPHARVIAPDLRGRGRSNGLAGPAGLDAHARDLVAVLDALGVERAVVVGHSMGAFVALVLGDLHPERVSRVVLVDGGLPLDLPEGLSVDEVIALVLGPTAERLAMRFRDGGGVPGLLARASRVPSRLDARARGVPFLRPRRGGAGAAARDEYATLEEDSIDQNTGSAIVDALRHLRHPTVLLTAERGLLDQVPALYAPERLPVLLAAFPGAAHRGPRREPLHDRDVGARSGCCRGGRAGAVGCAQRLTLSVRWRRCASSAGGRARGACGRGRRAGRGRTGTPRR